MIKRIALVALVAALAAGCQTKLILNEVATKTAPLEVGDDSLALVALAKIQVAIKRGDVVGAYDSNILLCAPPYSTLTWGSGRYTLRDIELADIFYEEMSNAGFDVAGNPNQLFNQNEDFLRAEYKIGGQLTTLRMNLCNKVSFWTGRSVGDTGDAYVKMKWQVYSNRDKRVVYALTTEGRGSTAEATVDGWLISMQNAFALAVSNFAADAKFRSFLRQDRAQSLREARSDPVRDIGKIVALPEVPLFTTPIKRNVTRLKVSAVTVSAGAGHGSGFIVSEEGLVLTNTHVVGDARFVTIQLVSGREVVGEVLRRDRKRDVALILVEGRGYVPLPIRPAPVEITEEVFAVGTPRSRELANTVTRGSVSGLRSHPYDNNMQFIQTDTDIHGGSSGGPLVDAMGNVVGVAVAGYSDSDSKSSIGLNLFIPIGDALRHLGLEVRKMPKTYSPVKQIQLTEQAGAATN